MVAPAGYACPRCAAPLRFQAETGWTCDACRVVYPAQGTATAAPAARGPRTRSAKTKIAVAAGTVALGLMLVIVVVVVLGGGSSGGKATPREVFEAAVDRATAGDVDGLVALSIAPKIAAIADCESDRVTDRRIRVRADLRDTLDEWKGLRVTVTSVDEDGSPDVLHAGRHEMGCRLEHELVRQRFKVKVHTKNDAGDEGDGEVELTALRFGDGWYLDRHLGHAPSVVGLTKLEAAKNEMCACKDRACADGVSARYMDLRAKLEISASADDERRIATLTDELLRCQETAMMSGYDSP